MQHRFFLLFLATCVLSTACGSDRPVVGYDGPIPSDEARQLLEELQGETIADAGGLLDADGLELDGFAVIPNPRTGKSPVMRVSRGDRVEWIPLLTDGDVADLYRRVRGSAPDGIEGEMSEAYRQLWR